MKIPEFPDYCPIADAQEQIINYTEQFPPYSDFNYVNMQSWDLGNTARASMVHGNLAVVFPDYIDGNEFYSFLGQNRPIDTAQILLHEAATHSAEQALRLVPAVGALALRDSGLFRVEEEHDGHDYVLSLPDIAKKEGPRFKNMRQEIGHFHRGHGHVTDFHELNIADTTTQREMVRVFLGRETQKFHHAYGNELQAITRLFRDIDQFRLEAWGLSIDAKLQAFIIYEKLPHNWCMGHFWKADTAYRGIYRYLMHNLAVNLASEGYEFMNIEQDLGLEGLKHMKNLFRPVSKLHKYTVAPAH